MNALKPLQDIFDAGLQPVGRVIYLGLGFRPPKQNALEIDPNNLPTDRECLAVYELDVILVYHDNLVSYGVLRKLAGSLLQGRLRRLQVYDLDYGRVAFLKMAGL
jgi:hypothetical protein